MPKQFSERLPREIPNEQADGLGCFDCLTMMALEWCVVVPGEKSIHWQSELVNGCARALTSWLRTPGKDMLIKRTHGKFML
jgi:hypothetical protein